MLRHVFEHAFGLIPGFADQGGCSSAAIRHGHLCTGDAILFQAVDRRPTSGPTGGLGVDLCKI